MPILAENNLANINSIGEKESIEAVKDFNRVKLLTDQLAEDMHYIFNREFDADIPPEVFIRESMLNSLRNGEHIGETVIEASEKLESIYEKAYESGKYWKLSDERMHAATDKIETLKGHGLEMNKQAEPVVEEQKDERSRENRRHNIGTDQTDNKAEAGEER